LPNLASIVFRIAIISLLTLAPSAFAAAASHGPPTVKIAVLDLGNESTGVHVSQTLREQLSSAKNIIVIDHDSAKAAAAGVGYAGSLNLTLEAARDLGAAIGCDFFVVGDAQTLRRSPATGAPYFESFASIFVVSARSGRLVLWEKPSVRADTAAHAQAALLLQLTAQSIATHLSAAIETTLAREASERAERVEKGTPVIEIMSDESGEAASDTRPPRPFRRLKPDYPTAAAESLIEAIVDVLVDVDDKGEVGRVEISRWAGYGLDESVVATVKQLHFFPAMRNRRAIPMRVLLRYNFRKPQ
jgi:TonB family protein